MLFYALFTHPVRDLPSVGVHCLPRAIFLPHAAATAAHTPETACPAEAIIHDSRITVFAAGQLFYRHIASRFFICRHRSFASIARVFIFFRKKLSSQFLSRSVILLYSAQLGRSRASMNFAWA